ncbi:hypothetical protein EDO6_03654 [Paenibacillus xylanexedens]|nr:hypothetical protein EDO6_03654 [Paenibacillus xylanexedens]
MIFDRSRGIHFNLKSKIFSNFPVYTSNSVIGNYVDEEGYMGPIGCGAVSLDKRNALIKSFSESVERRSLMFGAKSVGEASFAYDLLSEKVVEIPTKLTKYNEYNPTVDTTGTAVHTDPYHSLYNALVELLEKNCIFLFWYGKYGTKLRTEDYKSIYINKMDKDGLIVHLFLQDFFFPLLVVLCIVEDKEGRITYKFGSGSGMHLNDAVDKAVSEAYFLGRYHDLKNYFEEGILNKHDQFVMSPKAIDHIQDLLNVKYNNNSPDDNITDFDSKTKITKILGGLPKWITSMNVSVLQQKIHTSSISIKVSSNELLTHIPQKKFINEKVMINQRTLGLTAMELENYPDCPII